MPGRMRPEERAALLDDLAVGVPPTQADIQREIDDGWLLPSQDGRNELRAAEWAMSVLLTSHAAIDPS